MTTPHDELWAIVHSICDPNQIDIERMMSRARHPRYIQARGRCMRAFRQAGRSLAQIGRFFRRHHTTILHALQLPDVPFEELPPLPVEPPPHRIVIPQFARPPPPPPRPRYLPSPLERRRMTLAERLRFSERRAFVRVLYVHEAEFGPRPYAHFHWWLQEGQFLKSKAAPTLSQRNDLAGVDADTHEHYGPPCETLEHGEADECQTMGARTRTTRASEEEKEVL